MGLTLQRVMYIGEGWQRVSSGEALEYARDNGGVREHVVFRGALGSPSYVWRAHRGGGRQALSGEAPTLDAAWSSAIGAIAYLIDLQGELG